MEISYLEVFDSSPDIDNIAFQTYGYAAWLLSSSNITSDIGMRYIHTVVGEAFSHKKIKFYFNDDGMVVGMVIWACLTKDVEKRIIEKRKVDLHKSEWNEGDRLWILDFVAPFGNIKYIIRDIKKNILMKDRSVSYFRKGVHKMHLF
ncbi:MAG: toxin-activating lysine-acyltransferase [Proteobacteria bacterium]|nr:toxin-activating lysine-acyltransferase [Pseudomonadota bacterium]